MREHGVPLLALVLACAASSRLRLQQEVQDRLEIAFTDAVVSMDNADRAYRGTIEGTLPHELARTVLSAMASFRECAHQVREAAMHEIREIYRRNNRPWNWLDPLDPSPVLPHGLSHVDGTRVASVGDRARSQVDNLRRQTNEHVLVELSEEQIEALRQAKIQRRERFEQAVRTALTQGEAALDDSELRKTAEHLAALADGWY
ncbi:MAG TPA: hypothetical protein VFN37_03155 [Candidatus Baltobacteraceae bacterium]|nr:hypothetical protein [Candidatus Baltobacteraceae bacterium]